MISLKKDQPISIDELKSQLEIAEKEKKALLRLALHDLRSPMNKLFALVGLFKMSDAPVSAEQADYLDKMELVIRDGLSRMRNLMDLKAIEDETIETMYESIRVSKLVQKVIREQTPDAARKNIKIYFIEKPIALTTDTISCLRILDQLFSNAVKFSPKNSSITVKLEEQEESVFIHIADTGPGISTKEQNELYKKFTPLSTRATGGESCTGIGLYIASWMAKNIGGSIEYTNDNKSEFTLCLPKVSLA